MGLIRDGLEGSGGVELIVIDIIVLRAAQVASGVGNLLQRIWIGLIEGRVAVVIIR